MKIKKELIIYICIFILTCVIFLPFLSGHYATDTYNIANVGYKNYAINWSLKDGRIFMALIGLIANITNISVESYVFITLIMALLISNISVIVLFKIVEKYKKPKNTIQKIILIIIGYVTIFNFMYLEDMYFVESIVMALSVLLYLISANILVEKNKNYLVKSMFLNIIGILCYQGTIGIFFSFVILFTILKNKNDIKEIVIDLIKCGIIALLSVLVNILIVKIICNIFEMKQTRLGKISDIFDNILVILMTLPNILQETCNLFPKNAFLLFLTVLTVIILLYKKENSEDKKRLVYKYICIMIITILGSCVTYILTLTSFYTGRLRNALGALLGILFIFLYVETDIFEKKEKLNLLVFMTLISYFVVNILNYESIMLEHKKVNMLERQDVEKVEEYIEQYEKDTGIDVTKIVKIPMGNNAEKTYFQNTKNKTTLTHNALRTNWASDGVINFYTNRNLETIELTDEQENMYIKNQDPDLEYQCIEDILYIKIYCF